MKTLKNIFKCNKNFKYKAIAYKIAMNVSFKILPIFIRKIISLA